MKKQLTPAEQIRHNLTLIESAMTNPTPIEEAASAPYMAAKEFSRDAAQVLASLAAIDVGRVAYDTKDPETRRIFEQLSRLADMIAQAGPNDDLSLYIERIQELADEAGVQLPNLDSAPANAVTTKENLSTIHTFFVHVSNILDKAMGGAAALAGPAFGAYLATKGGMGAAAVFPAFVPTLVGLFIAALLLDGRDQRLDQVDAKAAQINSAIRKLDQDYLNARRRSRYGRMNRE